MSMFESKKKSGDSARQDEEKARTEDQKTEKSPEERNDELPKLLEGSVDRAKEAGADAARIAFLEAQLSRLTEVVSGLQKQTTENSGKLKTVKPEELLPKYIQCGTCGQYQKVCGGKHKPARVLPWMSENMEGFTGIKRNGVNYFGMCLVPVAMYEDIMCGVSNFETMKRKSRFDLGKIRGWDKEIASASAAGLALGLDSGGPPTVN